MAEPLKDPGSGIVVRGLLLFAFMVLLVLGGYFLFFGRAPQRVPDAVCPPEYVQAQIGLPQAGYPASLQWGAVKVFHDTLPSAPGWEIRYTAARNLTRRGSQQVPWDTFIELLDEEQQFRNFRARLHDGRIVPDEAAARQIILSGLKAISEWHKKQGSKTTPSADLLRVYLAVDKLAQSPVAEVKMQAEKTRTTFLARPWERGVKTKTPAG